jgi:aspartate kinase
MAGEAGSVLVEPEQLLEYLLIIAKFGGSSMAHPDLVRDALEHEGNDAFAVVVSAPGVDENYPVKATNMLIDYRESVRLVHAQAAGEASPEELTAYQEHLKSTYAYTFDEGEMESGGYRLPFRMAEKLFRLIPERFKAVVDIMDPDGSNAELAQILETIPGELTEGVGNTPVEYLGEYLMAKLFAAYTGRDFVDARELIALHEDGKIDRETTRWQIRERLADRSKKFVVPGFYGLDSLGDIALLDRGGSDITAALIAEALDADEHHNWSDAPGYMSADPKVVNSDAYVARMQNIITYLEAAEFASYGEPSRTILHGEVAHILRGSGVVTRMRHTFGDPKSSGTRIEDSRDTTKSPVIGVTGRGNVISLGFGQIGLAGEVGATTSVFEALKELEIPYDHIASGEHHVTIYIPDSPKTNYRKKLEQYLGAGTPSETIRKKLGEVALGDIGMVQVVGEGLIHADILRSAIDGKVKTALAKADIGSRASTSESESPGITVFVKPDSVGDAVRVIHRALQLGRKAASTHGQTDHKH